MFFGRDRIVADETNLTAFAPPPLDTARGIVMAMGLSAALWGVIASIVWLLTR
jgi:hypothetical protein